jgi:hypothetical protein
VASNEYDSLVEQYASGDTVDNEYSAIIDEIIPEQKQQLQSSFFVAKDRNPDQYAKAIHLSKKTQLPAEMVDRNIQEVERALGDQTDYDKIIDETPGLSRFLQNPDNAAIAKDDLEVLGKVDKATQFVKSGILSDLSNAAQTGFNQLGASTFHLGAVYGFGNINELAPLIAERNKRARELQEKMPSYAKEFSSVVGKESDEATRAFDDWKIKDSFNKVREGKILEGLRQFYAGELNTLGEHFLDQKAFFIQRQNNYQIVFPPWS